MATYSVGTTLAALGDPRRRTIFELVARAPAAVVEIASELPISRPAVSQHLKVLKQAGLVIDRAAGNRRIYEVNPEAIGDLRRYLDRFWDLALHSFKAAAEKSERKQR